jgi:RNA polymerase sigma-70 factor (ECF subfamily)
MGFHTTRWDLVLNSGNIDSPDFGKALAELCSIYWYPLYAFARYKGLSEHDAQDLTQSFFLHLLQKRSLKEVHPEKGRFRSFLLASFQNHISAYRQHACAAKRGGGCDVIYLDAQAPHERDRLEPTDDLTGKANVFERLRVYLNITGTEDADSYEEAAQELGLSLGGVKTQVCRLRKRFRIFLRHEVAQTVLDPGEIDAEIHALYEALVATEGRLDE